MANEEVVTNETTNQGEPKLDSSDINKRLKEVQDQLVAMNRENTANLNVLADAIIKNKKTDVQVEQKQIESFYDTTPAELEDRITNKVVSAVSGLSAKEKQTQAIIVGLVQEYPELSDTNSAFYKRAIEKETNLPSYLRNTSEGYKLAAHETAAELGLLPKSKRQTLNEDTFSMSSSGGSRMSTDNKSKRVKISDNTMAVAELMGVNVKDPKVLKRLENAAQRKSWGKYKTPGGDNE